MKLQLVAAVAVTATLLTGCQTAQEAAEAQVDAVCTHGGYAPGTPDLTYCMNSLRPTAIQMEQQRRSAALAAGATMMARGLNPPPAAKVTCVQEFNVTRCY